MSSKFSKIVIFGSYKTGTTGLFYKIANSLPGSARYLFEAQEYKPEIADSNQWVLAKIILWFNRQELIPRYESFLNFDKAIYLTRDPRDWLVSATLFMIQQEESLYTSDESLKLIFRLLQKKQRDPNSVSLVSIIRCINELSNRHTFTATMDWMKSQYEWLLAFERRIPEYIRLRYEDFVDERIAELEAYLGVPLKAKAEVDIAHAHVPRTKSYGNWKDWFTPDDILYFRPLFTEYMETYGYEDAWAINEYPNISHEHSIEYVLRTVNKRRSLPFTIDISAPSMSASWSSG